MSRIDVSVIMPLYNAKDYVKLAVDSVLNQTLHGVEVVIVDDCSTDGSLELCRELYGHDERVKLIKQPRNAGPGEARNTAIRNASGEYVAFLDSDDEMVPDNLQKMFEAAKRYNADVVHNTHMFYPMQDEDGKTHLQLLDDSVQLIPMIVGKNSYPEEKLLTDDLNVRLEDWQKDRLHWSVCNKMIRRSFLLDNGIVFPQIKVAEDMVFCFQCLFKAKNYVSVPGGGYVYRLIMNSITRGRKSSAGVVSYLKAQIGALNIMRGVFQTIPFFKENPDKAVTALEFVLGDVEKGYVRPAFQVLGEDTLRSDGVVGGFLHEKFGELSPYVEFMFYELHKNYEPIEDWAALLVDPKFWEGLAKTAREKGMIK